MKTSWSVMQNRDTSINNGDRGLLLKVSDNLRKVIFIVCVVLCLTTFISPSLALVMGLMVALFTGHPYVHLNRRSTHLLLQVSVVGLGFGMNMHTATQAGREGILFTIASITGTLIFGYLIGRSRS